MGKRRTPISDGVFLTEREIDSALHHETLLKRCNGDLDKFALLIDIDLYWLPKSWQDRHGLYAFVAGRREIWLPHSTKLGERIGFFHELHHALFGKRCIGFETLSREEIARYEGKAVSYSAIAVMPLLPDTNEAEDIIRMFGPHHRDVAHYRIKHFEHYGW